MNTVAKIQAILYRLF